MREKSPLMKTVGEIRDRFDMTEADFYRFLKMGMPVRRINGQWYGHYDNVYEFLRQATVGEPISVNTKDIPVDMR